MRTNVNKLKRVRRARRDSFINGKTNYENTRKGNSALLLNYLADLRFLVLYYIH